MTPLTSPAGSSARKASGALGSRWVVPVVLVGGLLARLWQAHAYFLNPDEVLHTLLASNDTLSQTYRATLTTAHPPLFIVMLHYWRWLGQTELVLRLPSVVAGVACCWLMYLWLEKIADRPTAFLGLLLFSFAPALIELSAEVRQYALMMMFMSACLYFSERALEENSPGFMMLSSASLCGALLTHYSSLLFAFAAGLYLLTRFMRIGMRNRLFATWALGQVAALILIAILFVTHVSHLERQGVARDIASTWLRQSIYHNGENNPLWFPLVQTLRVFTYIFSHGLLGAVALVAFFAAIGLLLRQKPTSAERSSGRELALLLVVPFVANCAAALAGAYPYGRTRHNSYLALFAITGIALGLASWPAARRQIFRTALALVLCLAFCNFFPAPPPLIRPRDHELHLMRNAATYLHQNAPPGSLLFADDQSAMLLGYYVCGRAVVQEQPPSDLFHKEDCGSYTAITTSLQKWDSAPEQLTDHLAEAARTFGIAQGSDVWFFNAGWIMDSASELRKELPTLGCSTPQNFGENIQVCRLKVPARR